MSNLLIPSRDVDILAAAEAWVQLNQNDFIFPKLPMGLFLVRQGFSGKTTLHVPKLDTFLRSKAVQPWVPGQSKRDSRQVQTDDFDFYLAGYDALPTSIELGTSTEDRLAFLRTQAIPGMLSECWQAVDAAIVALCSNTSLWGAAKAFSGTAPLDSPAVQATQSPIADINRNLRKQRVYRSAGKRFLVAIMDSHVAEVLSSHPDYTGAGYRDGSTAIGGYAQAPVVPEGEPGPGQMSGYDAFAEVFRRVHRLDYVIIGKGITNDAQDGLTPDIQTISNGLLWHGILCAPGAYDCSNPMVPPAVDGAFLLGMRAVRNGANVPGGRYDSGFFVRSTVEQRLQVEAFDAEVTYGVNAIRTGDSWGCFYDSADIFGTLP